MSRLTVRKSWCIVVCGVTYVSTNCTESWCTVVCGVTYVSTKCTEVMVYCSVQGHLCLD